MLGTLFTDQQMEEFHFQSLPRHCQKIVYQIGSDGKIYVIKNYMISADSTETGLYVYEDAEDGFIWRADLPQELFEKKFLKFNMPALLSEVAWLFGFNEDTNAGKTLLKLKLSAGAIDTIEDKSNSLPPYFYTYSNYCCILEVKPDDPDVVIIGGVDFIQIKRMPGRQNAMHEIDLVYL